MTPKNTLLGVTVTSHVTMKILLGFFEFSEIALFFVPFYRVMILLFRVLTSLVLIFFGAVPEGFSCVSSFSFDNVRGTSNLECLGAPLGRLFVP